MSKRDPLWVVAIDWLIRPCVWWDRLLTGQYSKRNREAQRDNRP